METDTLFDMKIETERSQSGMMAVLIVNAAAIQKNALVKFFNFVFYMPQPIKELRKKYYILNQHLL